MYAATMPPMDGYGEPAPLVTAGAPGPGMPVHHPHSGHGFPGQEAGHRQTPFAPGIATDPTPEKPLQPLAADPQKLWEINALKALATHPHTFASRASMGMACPDCDAQGVTLNYLPTEYRHGALRWSSQQLHFVEAHGHDLPIHIRQALPGVMHEAMESSRASKEPRLCPQCGKAIDMSMQGPRELMCFACGLAFPPSAGRRPTRQDERAHPPANPHMMAAGSAAQVQSPGDLAGAEGFAPDSSTMAHVARHGTHLPETSRHRQRYIDLLAEMEQARGVRRALASTGVDCPKCRAAGYAIKIPIGTMSYLGVTWGAHLLHDIAVHGHPIPDDVKMALKTYRRHTHTKPVHDPSRYLSDRGEGRVAGGTPFTHFEPETTADHMGRYFG